MSPTLHQLATLGAPYHDPMTAIDWNATAPERPWLPPPLLDFDDDETIPPDRIIDFSRVEFARLCAAGMWLEGLLISRAMRGGCLNMAPEYARIILQEVREEAGHSLMFVEMIDRAGLGGVGLLGDTRLLTWVAHRLHPDSAEFWAMVYIGESVTDTFALKALRAGADEICPVARQVLRFHHKEEARHMAAARALVKARVDGMSALRRRAFHAALKFLLQRFLKATLYPTEASLRAIGLPDPAGTARIAARSPARARLANECAAPALRFIERTIERPVMAGERAKS